jgi:hypothetical protein
MDLQSLAPTPVSSGRRPIVKIISESTSQHDEIHVVPTPLSGIRVGRRRKYLIINILFAQSFFILLSAFLENDDVNVIVLDWRELASQSYTTATNGGPAVGRGLGQYITWMVDSGFLSYEKVHIIGYSLGGHIAGCAGRETGGRAQRVTGIFNNLQ